MVSHKDTNFCPKGEKSNSKYFQHFQAIQIQLHWLHLCHFAMADKKRQVLPQFSLNQGWGTSDWWAKIGLSGQLLQTHWTADGWEDMVYSSYISCMAYSQARNRIMQPKQQDLIPAHH